ncbi:MAG: hypothetical protein HKL89_06565 [Candidatus Dormibacteraeota bacterium]|nr:hypothetical protein [Candidatus Dormibacteraeota bacterium]
MALLTPADLRCAAGEIDRVRADKDFTERARKLLERDKELLDRLAQTTATAAKSTGLAARAMMAALVGPSRRPMNEA